MKGSPLKTSDPATEAVERLLLVTLALEQTLQGEHYVESDALFAERQNILEELAQLSLTPKSRNSIERVQAAERRIIGYLSDWRTAASRELDQAQSGRRANSAYLGAVLGRAFSMDGRH